MKPIRVLCLALALGLAAAGSTAAGAASTPTIDTVAGGIPSGLPATEVSLTSGGIDFAPNGDVYFTDPGNGIVWRLTPDGTIHHVAGSGRVCLPTGTECRGDDGPAKDAFFSAISGIAVAEDGDIFVAEMRGGNLQQGYRPGIVRRIDAQTGIVSLFAGNGDPVWSNEMDGGPAVEAAIGMPQSLELDSKGNLYIADVLYHRIFRVTPGGTIIHVAGCGSYSWPTCVWAQDGSPVEGTTIGINAGGNGNGFGIALNAADELYISDFAQILKLDDASESYRVVMGKLSTYATFPGEGEGGPASEARVGAIVEMAFGPNGDLYLLEGGGSYDSPWSRIQKIEAPASPASIVRHVGGIGTGDGFSGDGGSAKTARFAFSQPTETWTGQGLAVNPAGEVFVSDWRNLRLRRIDASGIVTTVAGNGHGGPWAEWAVGSMQPGYLSIGLTARGGYSGDGRQATTAQLYGPKDVEVDRWGNVYVLDRASNRVRRIRPDGVIETVAGTGCVGMRCYQVILNTPLTDGVPATSAQLFDAAGIALDRTGTQLYIADAKHQRVRQVNLGTSAFTAYPLSTNPVTIQPGRIQTVFGPGQPLTCSILEPFCGEGLPATQYHAGRIQGITTDASGYLYVSDSYSNQVVRADLGTGIVTHVTGLAHASRCTSGAADNVAGRAAQLCGPTDLVVSPDARTLYFTESSEPGFVETLSSGYNYGSRVRKVDLTSPLFTTSVLAGTGDYGFSGDGGAAAQAEVAFPHGVAVGPDGAVYIADTGNHRIRRVGADGRITTVAGAGDFLNGTGCDLTGDGGPASEAELCAPNGLAFGPDGTLYVVDELNNHVRVVRGL